MSDTELAQAEVAVVAAWKTPSPSSDDPDFWALSHARHEALAVAYERLYRALPVDTGSYYAAIAACADAERRRDSAAESLAKQAVSS